MPPYGIPAITVLMPVYNAAPFLRAAVDSILNQSFGDFEFLIINDGSTDDSAAILTSYADARIRVVHNERNLGITAALNRGLRLARAELVARQDADDVSLPTRLGVQMAFLRNHPDVVLLGTRGTCISRDGRKLHPIGSPATDAVSIRWVLCFENPFIHGATIFRRGPVVTDLGGYDPGLPYCEDFGLWSKLAGVGPVANLPDRLVLYREHSASLMATMPATLPRERACVLKATLLATFPGRRLSTADLELLNYLPRGPRRSESAAFLRLVGLLLADYVTANPEARRSSSFSQTVASQYASLAALLARHKDPATLVAGWQALCWSPAGALAVFTRAVRRRLRWTHKTGQ